jgi:hypothetical protein
MAGLVCFARIDVILAILALAACGQQPASSSNQAASQPLQPPPPPAKAFAVEEKTDLIEFDFSWPAEAAAIPELAQRFRTEMDKARSELAGNAEEEKARRDKEGFDYAPFMSSTVYETAGQSPRLLSLRVDVGGYEGGAHGSFGVGALLWDRQSRREIQFADIFVNPANRDRLLTQRWCDALNRAREEKRGEPVAGGGLFDDCPTLDDIAAIPTDSDRDGRFDKLLLVASPYVAGPWVEGAYEIELAVTSDLVAGLKAEFQPSFEG